MRRHPVDLWLVLAAVVLVQAALTISGFSPWLTQSQYPDSDCYMRIQRVLNLYQQGAWYDSFEPRSNAPFGEQLHWTRPLDMILYAGAWIGAFVTDFRSALWDWGVFVSPALLCVGLVVWRWGLRLIASPEEFLVSSLMLLFSPMFSMAFMIGRPDHHGLIALCLLGELACLLRVLSGDERQRLTVYAGLWGGLGLWVSKESLVGAAAFGLALAIVWIWRGGREAARLAGFAQGMTLALLIALPIEYRPADWLEIRYARFTLVDVAFAGACALPWTVIARCPATRRVTRIGLSLAAGLTTLGIIALTYPRFLLGPTIDFSPAVVAWFRTVGEFAPLWPTTRETATKFLIHLGPTMIAIGWCARELLCKTGRPKPAVILLLVGNLAFLPLSLSAMRWAVSSNLMAALPWALAVSDAWHWGGRLRVAGREIPLRLASLAALVGGPVFAGALLAAVPNRALAVAPAHPDIIAKGTPGCDWKPISAYLAKRWPRGGIIFSYLFSGGELIWRTPFAVVGAPYGNDSSFADTNAILHATDDRVARAILARRRVDLVLLCTDSDEAALYEDPSNLTLHHRLTHGQVPAWLEPVTLPAGLSGRYVLFHPHLS